MTVAAVDRCLSLIEALAGAREPQELSALAAKVGLPNSAAHRILSTLAARGWVVQEPTTHAYALSLRLSVLALRNLEAHAVPNVVQKVLDDLAARTGEYCRLAVVEQEDLIWVARAQGATVGLRYEPDMGQEIVLHATANGKAWLASMQEADAARILRERGIDASRPLGPNCLTDEADVLRDLGVARAKGFATAVEEAEAGAAAVAVVFRAAPEEEAPVAGTVSVAGPLMRFPAERHEALAVELREAAEELSSVWPLRQFARTASNHGSSQ
ncbi:MAG: IclR family transcriptional regulator [Pseudomonadota bacterium]